MVIIYGINPALEALEDDGSVIRKVVVAKGRSGDKFHKLLSIARQRNIDVEFREREYLDRLAGRTAHQGVVCLGAPFSYVGVDDVIGHGVEPFRDHLVLILDSVTDPQNLGTLIRTAHCFGANGVIIPEDRAASVTPAVLKASAGAAQHTPIARVVNIAQTIDALKDRGFWIYGAEAEAAEDIRRVHYQGHAALVMGSEGRGLRPLVRKKCDFLISIPMRGKVGSLNVSVAAGVILFDLFTKRVRK